MRHVSGQSEGFLNGVLLHAAISLACAIVLLAAQGCSSTSDPVAPSTDTVVEILKKNAFDSIIFRITSVVPDDITTDILFLDPILSNRSIVALGESTHGTSEFVTHRHRISQYMIEHLKFRTIALETNFSSAQAINDYILGGSGSGLTAVGAISGWVYNNQEFVQFVEWLRTYNNGRAPADKVTFYGFDAQSAEPGAKRVRSYIAEHESSYLQTFDTTAQQFLTDFEELSKYNPDQLVSMIGRLVDGYQARWDQVYTFLNANKSSLTARSGEREYEMALQHWESVKQTFRGFVFISDELGYFNFRDTYMADNVDWIQKHENNGKLILWAHAGHSGKSSSQQTGTQMGYHLKQRHQDKYFTVGFFTNGGTVRVVHMSNGTPVLGEARIDPKPEHVLTQAFADGKWSQFFMLSSSISGNKALENLFLRPSKVYFIGADLERSTIEQTLGLEYDAIVFLEKTTATRPN